MSLRPFGVDVFAAVVNGLRIEDVADAAARDTAGKSRVILKNSGVYHSHGDSGPCNSLVMDQVCIDER
jgi:hypothetical protein